MIKYSELKTIGDYVRFATSAFNEAGLYFGHGTDNAWDEALALILHSLHLHHDINPLVFGSNLTKAERVRLEFLINERVTKRIPVPYLTHQAWFCGMPFYVDERVLIPRSPLAELIEERFAPWVLEQDVHAILDLCTGSGCIAVACAKAFPDAEVDAVDLSTDALTVAKINALRHGVEDQINLITSNLFEEIPPTKYDIIISNPPYVSETEMTELPSEFQHEPRLSLAAGPQGLDVVMQILKEAPNYLSKNGILIVEVGNSEVALSEALPEVPFTWLEFQRADGGVFLLTEEQVRSLDLEVERQ